MDGGGGGGGLEKEDRAVSFRRRLCVSLSFFLSFFLCGGSIFYCKSGTYTHTLHTSRMMRGRRMGPSRGRGRERRRKKERAWKLKDCTTCPAMAKLPATLRTRMRCCCCCCARLQPRPKQRQTALLISSLSLSLSLAVKRESEGPPISICMSVAGYGCCCFSAFSCLLPLVRGSRRRTSSTHHAPSSLDKNTYYTMRRHNSGNLCCCGRACLMSAMMEGAHEWERFFNYTYAFERESLY